MKICVDASLVLKYLLPEEGSSQVIELFKKWTLKKIDFIAPTLIDYEVGSVLQQKVSRSLLDQNDIYPIVDIYKRLEISCVSFSGSLSEAFSLAATLEQPTLYDVCYLLVAKDAGAQFVTADKRFSDAARPLFSFVKYYQFLN